MADNVPITAGSGTNIATDDVAGVHYQRVKLDGGADGAVAPIGGDSTNGLDVDVTRLPGAAHDSAVAGNPVVVGGISEVAEDTAPSNTVDVDGDTTRLALDRNGAVYSHPHPPRIWSFAQEYSTQQTDATVKSAPGAGLSLYVKSIYIMANAAVIVTLEEGTTTLKFRAYPAANGGVMANFAVPIKLAANTALTVTSDGPIVFTLVVTGYTAA